MMYLGGIVVADVQLNTLLGTTEGKMCIQSHGEVRGMGIDRHIKLRACLLLKGEKK